MAFFEGTIQEFHHFVGPRIRNQINTKTKKFRDARNGICEQCNNKAVLESAHIHGRDRRTIIESVLSSYISDGLVKVELLKIEDEIINQHYPIEQTFKFLCKDCHRKYDEPLKKNRYPNKNTTSVQADTKFSKLNRIKLWAKRPSQNNAKIVSAYMFLNKKGMVKFTDLSNLCNDSSSKYYIESFKSHYDSMQSDAGNSHGHVFDGDGEYVMMPTVVREEVDKYWAK